MSDSKVIKVDFAAEAPARNRKRSADGCAHRTVLVSESSRMLECKRCGEQIDPIWQIARWAAQWERVEAWRDSASKERERLAAEVAELKRERNNLKRQVKRAKDRTRVSARNS